MNAFFTFQLEGKSPSSQSGQTPQPPRSTNATPVKVVSKLLARVRREPHLPFVCDDHYLLVGWATPYLFLYSVPYIIIIYVHVQGRSITTPGVTPGPAHSDLRKKLKAMTNVSNLIE